MNCTIEKDLLCHFNIKRFSLSQEKDTSVSDNFIKKTFPMSLTNLHGELRFVSVISEIFR